MVFKCSTCKIELNKENGYFSKEALASHYCKLHHKEKARVWRKNNKNKVRNNRFKSLYGITTKDYETMFKNQGGKCELCDDLWLNGKLLCVDHDHKTGKVRALLCERHNWLLGNAKDDILTLYKAADYLEKHKKQVNLNNFS